MSIAWNPPRVAFPAIPRRRTAHTVPSPSLLEMADAEHQLRESKQRLREAQARQAEAVHIAAELRRLMENIK